MGKTRERLVDATKRLMASGTSEADAVKSLVEIGIGRAEANSIVGDAKALLKPRAGGKKGREPESFWDAPVGSYFGDIGREESHKRIGFSFLKWLAR